MAKKKSGKRKGGMAKKGRNIAKCARYRSLGIRERNKRRKVERHLKSFPNDKVARKSII